MRNFLPVIIIAVFFVLSFFVNRPRLRPVMAFMCAVLAVFFVVTAVIGNDHRLVSALFALLSIYMFLKYLKKSKPLGELKEER
jgi:quinol-cytochrome oxidoreductase complex cytochrome b subunit